MLVLKRSTREGEDAVVIRVPPSATERVVLVTVAGFHGLAVNLGFQADDDIRIVREECDSVTPTYRPHVKSGKTKR